MESEVSEEDIEECNLCLGMDWDEAIYCPQCYGSGKKIHENEYSKEVLNVD